MLAKIHEKNMTLLDTQAKEGYELTAAQKKKVTKRNKALYRTQVSTGDISKKKYKELTGEDY